MIDTHVNRKKHDNIKWQVLKDDASLLPMTIADMDIATPQFIRDELQAVLDDKVLGYTAPSADFYQSIITWERGHHAVTLTPEQIILMPGVVTGLSLAIRRLTQRGDQVIVMAPYYPPYKQVITDNGRQMVTLSLVQRDGQYVIDFDRLATLMTDPITRAIIVCNPQNPGGRVWTNAELQRITELAYQHKVFILADEIHDDTTFSDAYPVSMLSDLMGTAATEQTVLLKSATKAFNLAGVKASFLATKNPRLLAVLKRAATAEQLEELNTFGLVSTQAAYEQGGEWLAEVNQYLEENRNLAYTYISQHIPRIKPMYPEATYLMWLDFMAYGVTDKQLDQALREKGHLCLNPGIDYGQEGHGFMRLNFAVDRDVLKEALHRLQVFDKEM